MIFRIAWERLYAATNNSRHLKPSGHKAPPTPA